MYNWWWVFLSLIMTFMLYEQGQRQHRLVWNQLYGKFKELSEEKLAEEKKFQELQRQINSQSDPEWIELTLMKGLGLVPEGYRKAIFIPKDISQDNYSLPLVDSGVPSSIL